MNGVIGGSHVSKSHQLVITSSFYDASLTSVARYLCSANPPRGYRGFTVERSHLFIVYPPFFSSFTHRVLMRRRVIEAALVTTRTVFRKKVNMNHNDLTGQRFGRLVVIKRAYFKKGKTYWICRCDCGNEKTVSRTHLLSGKTSSCGCYKRECIIGNLQEHMSGFTMHGKSKTRLYKVWVNMHSRCNCETCDSYKYYGERGITVCDEWSTFPPFYEWAMANGYDPDAPYGKCTIDRIDVNGNYEPSNCRWVDMKVQASNKRNSRKNHQQKNTAA